MTSKDEKQGGAPAPVDPLGALIAGLRGEGGGRPEFRKQASALAGANRPWEQLPSSFKQAVRDDARSICAPASGARRGGGLEALLGSGYSRPLARQILRDIGRG